MDAAYDLVVIGAGSAGLVAAPFASAVGAKVLLVESDRIGGDCTWTGCIPSKALIHTAGIVHSLRDAVALAGGVSAPTLDAGRIMERVRAAIDGVYAFETADALAKQGVEVAFGTARFVDKTTIDWRSACHRSALRRVYRRGTSGPGSYRPRSGA